MLTSGDDPEKDKEALRRLKRKFLEEVRNHFKPEFLNRIDEIIVLISLGREEIKKMWIDDNRLRIDFKLKEWIIVLPRR